MKRPRHINKRCRLNHISVVYTSLHMHGVPGTGDYSFAQPCMCFVVYVIELVAKVRNN